MLLLTKEYADEMKCWQSNKKIHLILQLKLYKNEYSQQEIETLDNRREMEKKYLFLRSYIIQDE